MKEMTRKQKDYFWIMIFLIPCIIVFLLFYLTPIITLVYTSFTKWDGANLPSFNGISNYIRLFLTSSFVISLKNLLYWALIAATVHVGFGILIALILFKEPFGWRFVRAVFMVPNVISVAAWAVIYRYVFNGSFGILNGIIRLIIPGFEINWFYESPYAFIAITLTWVFFSVIITLLVLGDLKAIPGDLHEAARIDGANELYITFKINLPLCRNAIGTGVLLAITSRIAMYEAISLTTRGGPGEDTMNIPLILVNSINNGNYGYANAASVIMLVLGIIALLIVHRLFRMNESVY